MTNPLTKQGAHHVTTTPAQRAAALQTRNTELQARNAELEHRNHELHERNEQLAARVEILELTSAMIRYHEGEVRTVAWKCLAIDEQELAHDLRHLRLLVEHADGCHEEHEMVVHGEGPGMTCVAISRLCA